jgi:hypothetical protein
LTFYYLIDTAVHNISSVNAIRIDLIKEKNMKTVTTIDGRVEITSARFSACRTFRAINLALAVAVTAP